MGDLRVDDEGEKSLTQERLASRRRAQEGEAFILAIGAKCWLKLKRNQQSRTITRRGRHTGAVDGTQARGRHMGEMGRHTCVAKAPHRLMRAGIATRQHQPGTLRAPSPHRGTSRIRDVRQTGSTPIARRARGAFFNLLVVSPGMRGGAGGVSTPVPTFALTLVPTIGSQARHRGHRERKHDDRQ